MVEFVMNNSALPATGYTPFYLNYRFEPVTPMDLIRDVGQTNLEGVGVFVKRMKKTFKLAMQMVQQAQQRQKHQADQRRHDQRFHSGEQVLLSTEHLTVEECTCSQTQEAIRGSLCYGPSGGTSGLRIGAA